MARTNKTTWIAAPLASLLLLCAIWVERGLFHLPAGDAAEYHATVRAVAADLPYRFGDWVGTDEPLPPAAVSLLRPNVLQGRRFRNATTGEEATLMIVQCQDARDMGGHYPPVCYPAHGWTEREASARVLQVDGLEIPVTVYRFTKESIEEYAEILIYNFFVRPDGSIESGRTGVRKAAGNPRTKGFGAGQLQLVFGPSMSEQRMDEVFGLVVAETRPILEAIRQGGLK